MNKDLLAAMKSKLMKKKQGLSEEQVQVSENISKQVIEQPNTPMSEDLKQQKDIKEGTKAQQGDQSKKIQVTTQKSNLESKLAFLKEMAGTRKQSNIQQKQEIKMPQNSQSKPQTTPLVSNSEKIDTNIENQFQIKQRPQIPIQSIQEKPLQQIKQHNEQIGNQQEKNKSSNVMQIQKVQDIVSNEVSEDIVNCNQNEPKQQDVKESKIVAGKLNMMLEKIKEMRQKNKDNQINITPKASVVIQRDQQVQLEEQMVEEEEIEQQEGQNIIQQSKIQKKKKKIFIKQLEKVITISERLKQCLGTKDPLKKLKEKLNINSIIEQFKQLESIILQK